MVQIIFVSERKIKSKDSNFRTLECNMQSTNSKSTEMKRSPQLSTALGTIGKFTKVQCFENSNYEFKRFSEPLIEDYSNGKRHIETTHKETRG